MPVKKKDIYEIVLKVLGLNLLFITLGALLPLLSTLFLHFDFGKDKSVSYLIIALINFVSKSVLGFILVFKTEFVLRMISKEAETEGNAMILSDKRTVYEMSLVIIGLIMILFSVPDLVVELNRLLTNKREFLSKDISLLILGAVRFLAGFFALNFAKGIADLLTGKRTEEGS